MRTDYSLLLEGSRGDAESLYKIGLRMLGALEALDIPKPKRVRRTQEPGEARPTWLTVISEAWDVEMGAGSFPFAQGARYLRPLVDKGMPEAEIAKRIGYYLRDAQRRDAVRFVNIAKFAQTIKDYDPDAPAFPEDK